MEKKRLKKKDKLTVYWSEKECDFEGYHPLGTQTQCDLGYLFSIFNDKFRDEMIKRGYDIRTLKFEISPMLPNKKKFNSLTEKYCSDE